LKRQPEVCDGLRRWRARTAAAAVAAVATGVSALALTFGTDMGHALASALIKVLRRMSVP
jgi:hypothetical protein